MMADDDDEGIFGGLYENGHWIWDDDIGALTFISDLPPAPVEPVKVAPKVPSGLVVFRDDLDLIEQDVKDVVIYTAPVNILSPMLINMLHLSTTERFLRALILCTSYYLQVTDEMAHRVMDLETKVRTPDCEILEKSLQENLYDLRVLVAKEYCVMLIGGADTKNFHHMGPAKKRQSLSDKDARFIEMLLRICVQIVWLALGRRSLQLIELETHRLFKTEIFNTIEHNIKSGYISQMTSEEHKVLLGRCVKRDKKLNTRSPLINEVFCHREIDFRLMGLGTIKYHQKSPRQNYFWHAIVGKEEHLVAANVSLGIIGLSRSRFDTMLRPLPDNQDVKSKASVSSRADTNKSVQQKSGAALYPPIVLPEKSTRDKILPPLFPEDPEPKIPVNNIQRLRWQNRLAKLLGGSKLLIN